MGLYLSLLPIHISGCYSHEILSINQDYELYDLIKLAPSTELEKPIPSYLGYGDNGEHCYGDIIEDPYGTRLRYVYAKDLLACKIDGPQGAYVNAMDDHARIILYWS